MKNVNRNSLFDFYSGDESDTEKSDIKLKLTNKKKTQKKEYSLAKKKKLKERLSKMKPCDDSYVIFCILYDDTKDIMVNNNGAFLNFNKLKPETYYKLEKYVKCMEKNKRQNLRLNNDQNYDLNHNKNINDDYEKNKENISLKSDEYDQECDYLSPDDMSTGKNRLSNKEKMILFIENYNNEKKSNDTCVYSEYSVHSGGKN